MKRGFRVGLQPHFNFSFMVSLQYIGQSHTFILLPGEKVKTKVAEGEIIEMDLPEKEIKGYLNRGFQIAGEGADKPAKKADKPAKKAK